MNKTGVVLIAFLVRPSLKVKASLLKYPTLKWCGLLSGLLQVWKPQKEYMPGRKMFRINDLQIKHICVFFGNNTPSISPRCNFLHVFFI
jgi:hypothetical protein